jgi:predicted nucleic acid-binding Zn ribbon protein
MTALHDTDDLTCPRCGASLAGITTDVSTVSAEESIRVPVDCPDCEAPLDLVITSAQPDAIGVDVFVEDRRDDDSL